MCKSGSTANESTLDGGCNCSDRAGYILGDKGSEPRGDFGTSAIDLRVDSVELTKL